jgi:hypothetical protein
LQAQRKKEAFLAYVTLFLHKKDMFLYNKEDNMPDMAKIENSLLRYQVSQKFVEKVLNLHLIFACLVYYCAQPLLLNLLNILVWHC